MLTPPVTCVTCDLPKCKPHHLRICTSLVNSSVNHLAESRRGPTRSRTQAQDTIASGHVTTLTRQSFVAQKHCAVCAVIAMRLKLKRKSMAGRTLTPRLVTGLGAFLAPHLLLSNQNPCVEQPTFCIACHALADIFPSRAPF